MRLKLKMIYTILRGGSVCYRMHFSPQGLQPFDDERYVIAHNVIRGGYNGVIADFSNGTWNTGNATIDSNVGKMRGV